MPSPQSTLFQCTLFLEPHPTWSGSSDEEITALQFLEAQYMANELVRDGLVLGFVGQLEVCPSSARLHLQFCARVAVKATAVGFAERLRASAGGVYWHSVYVEVRQVGDLAAVRKYNTKEDTRALPDEPPIEFGVLGDAGKASHPMALLAVQADVKAGAGWRDLLEKHPWEVLGAHTTLLNLALSLYGAQRDPDAQPAGVLLVGPSGSGKTWYVRKWCTDNNYKSYTLPLDAGGSSMFVTPEAGEADCLILEDFRGQGLTMTQFLNLVDRGPFKLQTKGGWVNIKAHMFAITSNEDPESWWPKLKIDQPERWEANMKAVRRRIQEWFTMPHYKLAFRAWQLEKRME